MSLSGLDLWKIIETGVQQRLAMVDPWHDDDLWHASGLSDCTRAQILKKSGLGTDGITTESALNFELGHYWHKQFEQDARAYEAVEPRFKVIAAEVGGEHPELRLKARCDLLFSWEGMEVICDYKTEHPFARDHRVKDAQKLGQSSAYKWEHRVQVAATALVLEHLGVAKHVEHARLVYLNKANLSVDQVPVPITEGDRQFVIRRIKELEDWKHAFATTQALPMMVTAPDDWRCKPRAKNDERGLYCTARSACMEAMRRGF